MLVKNIAFNAEKIKDSNSTEREAFKVNTQMRNIIYFFFSKKECVYVGETSCSLYDRCFTHTPKHSEKSWFNRCDEVFIIQFDNNFKGFERRAIEASFILAYKSAGYKIENKY